MKRKKLLNTSLIAMLAMSMIMVLAPTARASSTDADKIRVSPAELKYVKYTECECNQTDFTIEVIVTNISDCAGYMIKLDYNSTVMNMTSWTFDTGTPCSTSQLACASGDRVDTDASVAGSVKISTVWKAATAPCTQTGDTVAAEIDFDVIHCPPQIVGEPQVNTTMWSDLELDPAWTRATDSGGEDINYKVIEDGYYECTMVGRVPGAPVCSFTVTPGMPFVSDIVTCTDTSSQIPPATIVVWIWGLTGPATNITKMQYTYPTMQFHCDGPGPVNVSLTVMNSDGKTASCWQIIEQRERLGCILDVYTSENRFCGQTTEFVGKGINEPADALSPDVNITLFAEVTWNGAPRMHVLVAFEVLLEWEEVDQELGFPEGYIFRNECIAYRTAETDKKGIATIWLRVPTPCDRSLFGKWIVVATAKIQEIKQEDQLRFDMGYLIQIKWVMTVDAEEFPTIVPKDTFCAPCDTIGVIIAAKNLAWNIKMVLFVVTVYDDCDVPIGQCLVWIPAGPGYYCHPEQFYGYNEIHVPQWTYVGLGKVYVSAFTNLPRDCGVPYCPEASTTVILEWCGDP